METWSEEPQALAARRTEQLLALPLLSELTEDSSREAVAYEVGLFCGSHSIPDGMPQRESYVRFESHEPNQVLIELGDLSTEMFLVLKGDVSALLVERDRGTDLLDTYGPGDWFGETSALSHRPSLISAVTATPCEVAVFDTRLFKLLYGEDDAFRERIDARYRNTSLVLHLRTAPLFAGVSSADLAGIRDHAELCSFRKGEVIAAEGAPAETFYLVRSGGVKCTAKTPGGADRVLAYYMGNSSFGEHSILTADARWSATYEAMAWTDVVSLPRRYFEHLLESNPTAHRTIANAANLIVSQDDADPDRLHGAPGDSGMRERLSADEIDVMVHKQSLKGGEALVINLSRCIRCNVCVESCVAVHDDGISRISKTGTKISTNEILITACYSCAIPECMQSCNYGAIRRDKQGLVRFVYDNCVGCTACVDACPYGVIRMVEPSGEASSVINIGGEEIPVDGKAIKCDLCAGLPFEACVYNCPTSAISRRAPEDLFTN